MRPFSLSNEIASKSRRFELQKSQISSRLYIIDQLYFIIVIIISIALGLDSDPFEARTQMADNQKQFHSIYLMWLLDICLMFISTFNWPDETCSIYNYGWETIFQYPCFAQLTTIILWYEIVILVLLPWRIHVDLSSNFSLFTRIHVSLKPTKE